MPRSPRSCIFCDHNANSKEHIWPVWLHEHLGPVPERTWHHRPIYNYHPSTGEVISGPTGRQGDQRTIRVRAVCRSCNSGWMSELESDVRPYLTPIVKGEPVTLLRPAIAKLAQWISLKAMIAEHAAPNVALTPRTDRQAFAESLAVPEYYRVYVAHNISDTRLFYHRHSHCVALSPEGPQPPLDGTEKNIQTVTMVAGRAVLHVTAARIENFTLEGRLNIIGFHDRCRIWPEPPGPISFPARPNLNQKGIDFVATSLERMLALSRTTWADFPIG
jgi:hypothetical protein